MARAPHMAGPLVLSTALHATLVFGLAYVQRFAWPAAPIPIEVVRPRPHAAPPPPSPPVEKPQPERPAINKEAIARRARPGAGKPSPQPSPAPATADLKPFAPDDANLVLLLSSEKLRRSPYRAAVETLLSALPDYDTLLGGTGLSPINDLEALLIATADPRSVTATFLAARYHDSERLRAIAERKLQPWDPRVFRTLRPGLTVLTRPDGAARLDEALHGPDAGDDPRGRWLRDLENFDRLAQASDGPALLVTISDAQALFRFGGNLPTPLALALAMSADASPSLRLRAVFATPDDAAAFAAAWPDVVRRFRTATMLIGLGSALDGITVARDASEVELTGRLPERQLQIALQLALDLLPHHGGVDGGAPLR